MQLHVTVLSVPFYIKPFGLRDVKGSNLSLIFIFYANILSSSCGEMPHITLKKKSNCFVTALPDRGVITLPITLAPLLLMVC